MCTQSYDVLVKVENSCLRKLRLLCLNLDPLLMKSFYQIFLIFGCSLTTMISQTSSCLLVFLKFVHCHAKLDLNLTPVSPSVSLLASGQMWGIIFDNQKL